MTDVFISYKRRLRPRVEEIAAALRALGVSVWYDAALEAGTSFSAEISHEVRTAGCVLVCWSDDAFPHGGDTSGWVVGEATIGQGRGRLVPVLLEPSELDPPWNTLHTESLIDWSAGQSDHVGWRNVLGAIGRHIGRPELADEAAATNAGAVAPAVRRMPPASLIASAGFASAAISGIGAALLSAVDPQLRGGYWAMLAGIALAALPLAVLFWRLGVLNLLKALALVAAFVASFALAAFLAVLAISPLPFRMDPARFDLTEIIYCLIAGFLGAGLSLAAFPLLGAGRFSGARIGRIAGAGVILSGVAGLVAAMPFFNLEVGNSAALWMAPIWQLVYAPLLAWVLRPQAGRSASTM